MTNKLKDSLDFEKDINIDESALDIECLNLPTLVFKYGRYIGFLQAKKAKLEERKKYIASKLTLEANNNPAVCCGKDRATIKDIESFYTTHPDYVSVLEELNKLYEELEFAQAAFEGIRTKKSQIDNLVKLFVSAYWAGPSVPRDLVKEVSKQRENERVNSKVKLSINDSNKERS